MRYAALIDRQKQLKGKRTATKVTEEGVKFGWRGDLILTFSVWEDQETQLDFLKRGFQHYFKAFYLSIGDGKHVESKGYIIHLFFPL